MTIHGDRMPQPDELGSVDVRVRSAAPGSARASAGRAGRRWFSGSVRDSAYVLARAPLSLAAFILVVTTLSLGAGLLVLFVGLAVLVLSAMVARAVAHTERSLLRGLTDRAAPTPAYLHGEGGTVRRLTTVLRDPQSWLDIGWCLVGFPISAATWPFVVAWWSAALGGLSWPLWGWTLPQGGIGEAVLLNLGVTSYYPVAAVFWVVVGAVFAATLPLAMRGLRVVNAVLAEQLLCGRAQWQAEIDRQRHGRSAARSAQSDALRRLERDIHDGPQQRLVRLGMDLGRARHQMGTDPQRAGATIDEAIAQTRATLDELRALSRGIAPPVLVDRGLVEALRELVTRASVPVHLTVEIEDDLPDDVQTAAYFVVSESLTNVAKHSMATYALVDVHQEGGLLVVGVQDDGVGGAQLAKGHGLLGLSDRARAVDGLLTVSSPAGGPTEIRAELPCAS